MKTTFTFLAVALLVLNQTKASTAIINEKPVLAIQVESEQDLADHILGLNDKRNFAPVEDQTVFNPAIIFNTSFVKPIEEIIAQDNQIIDSNITDEGVRFYQEDTTENEIRENNQIIGGEPETEIRPLYLDRNLEDKIAEDNAIIENHEVSAYLPLDFEAINAKTTKHTAVNL